MLWNVRDQLRIQSWWSVINLYVISKNTGDFFLTTCPPTLSFSLFRDQQPTQTRKLSLPPRTPDAKAQNSFSLISPRANHLWGITELFSINSREIHNDFCVAISRTKTFLKNDCVRGTLLEVWPKNNSLSQLLLKWRLLCTTSITTTIAWHQQRISAPSARS